MIVKTLALAVGLAVSIAVCRFTVRDVGFVDLGDPTYQCFTFVADTNSPGVAAAARETAKSVFAETNIDFAIVDLDDEFHPARRYLRELAIERFPTTVLVRPDGEALEVPFGGTFAAVGAKVIDSVATSPLRQRLTEAVIRRYCVVLLVESADAAQNTAAARAVKAAFAEIDKVFDQMPKDVGALPEMIAVPRAEQTTERILLWSLDIRGPQPAPVVTFLFGRGRHFGSNLQGAAIAKDSVLGILSKAGQSCECGLDRSWMRGTRVPLRWDATTRQLAADVLGFDPDNPLVKSEVGSILAKGPNGQTGAGKASPTVADMLLGYAEEDEAAAPSALDSPAPASPTGSQPITSRFALWITLGGLLITSLGIAGLLMLRIRRVTFGG